MSVTNNNTKQTPNITNPLQNNNAAMVAIAYAAGIVAAKYPIFDLQTWNYIFLSVAGLAATIIPYALNRKSAVISTTANLAEVKTVEMDKTVPNGVTLAQSDSTPNNVVLAK